jgi:hypothetical protein
MTRHLLLCTMILAIGACGPAKPQTAATPACAPDRRAVDITNGSHLQVDVFLHEQSGRERMLGSINSGSHQEFDIPDQGWVFAMHPRQSSNVGPRMADSQIVRTRYFCR